MEAEGGWRRKEDGGGKRMEVGRGWRWEEDGGGKRMEESGTNKQTVVGKQRQNDEEQSANEDLKQASK